MMHVVALIGMALCIGLMIFLSGVIVALATEGLLEVWTDIADRIDVRCTISARP